MGSVRRIERKRIIRHVLTRFEATVGGREGEGGEEKGRKHEEGRELSKLHYDCVLVVLSVGNLKTEYDTVSCVSYCLFGICGRCVEKMMMSGWNGENRISLLYPFDSPKTPDMRPGINI